MPVTSTMQAVRFHMHGEPLDVLRLDEVAVLVPGTGHIRVRVIACGLTPADSALCRGLFAKGPPRGVGLEVSGTVDAIGDGVFDVSISVGDVVFGVPAFASHPSAGLAEVAVLAHWPRFPSALIPCRLRLCRWRWRRPIAAWIVLESVSKIMLAGRDGGRAA